MSDNPVARLVEAARAVVDQSPDRYNSGSLSHTLALALADVAGRQLVEIGSPLYVTNPGVPDAERERLAAWCEEVAPKVTFGSTLRDCATALRAPAPSGVPVAAVRRLVQAARDFPRDPAHEDCCCRTCVLANMADAVQRAIRAAEAQVSQAGPRERAKDAGGSGRNVPAEPATPGQPATPIDQTCRRCGTPTRGLCGECFSLCWPNGAPTRAAGLGCEANPLSPPRGVGREVGGAEAGATAPATAAELVAAWRKASGPLGTLSGATPREAIAAGDALATALERSERELANAHGITDIANTHIAMLEKRVAYLNNEGRFTEGEYEIAGRPRGWQWIERVHMWCRNDDVRCEALTNERDSLRQRIAELERDVKAEHDAAERHLRQRDDALDRVRELERERDEWEKVAKWNGRTLEAAEQRIARMMEVGRGE